MAAISPNGRPDTIRVGLAGFSWPLDPALVSTPDEQRIARALYATPLRTDAGGRVVPGLCTAWRATHSFRVWAFTCRSASLVAAELRRVRRLRASPANWIFTSVAQVRVPRPDLVVVELSREWRRFPYALTTIAAAPPAVRGPFRLVRGSRDAVEVRRGARRIVFRRLGRFAMVRGIRRGELDEAAIPLGDVGAFRGSPRLHVRPLLAVDVVEFGNDAVPERIRQAYAATANRGDYEALVAEGGATAAYAVAGPGTADPTAYRRALHDIPALPLRRVRIAEPTDPTLRYGLGLLYAQWREVGLGPQLVPSSTPADAWLVRDAALYPQREALLGPVGLQVPFGVADQHGAFDRLDRQLQSVARVIPICWVADARWVSPRLRAWRENVLGDVDYTRVTIAR